MNTQKKRTSLIALLLAAVMMVGLLPLTSAGADSLYIIPDSDTRELTYEELWEYKYDTLMYAFNEIYARHGYKFETGSRCYMWFTQMPWYVPNENENSKNHSATYSQCSKIENQNVDLIKAVRAEMRELGTTNPTGKGLPTPPAQNVNKPRGFSYVDLKAGQKLAVYTAPSVGSYRANNGKAACSTNGAVYALGYENGWMLMLYEANNAGQYRVGYVNTASIKGKLPSLPTLDWDESSVQVLETTSLTDDPALTGKSLMTLREGATVTYLTTLYNSDAWDYVETTLDGQTIRGFVKHGALSVYTGEDDAVVGNG